MVDTKDIWIETGIKIERERILKLLTTFPVGEIIMRYNIHNLNEFNAMINQIFKRIKEKIEEDKTEE